MKVTRPLSPPKVAAELFVKTALPTTPILDESTYKAPAHAAKTKFVDTPKHGTTLIASSTAQDVVPNHLNLFHRQISGTK